MKKTLVVAALSALLLTGCSSIDSGVITKKNYTAPYSTTEYDCITRDQKTQTCTVTMPRMVRHSATYKFDLKKGKETGWVHVNEGDYNKFQVGDCYGSCN
jgi:uncharacterized protein YceK